MRFCWTVASGGTFVGLVATLQHMGLDIWSASSSNRVPATFGNPIFAGQFLVITVMVTLGLTMTTLRRAPRSWHTIALSSALVLQFVGLYFTGSRGPWVGMALALVLFIMASALFMGRKRTRQLLIILSVSVVATFALSFLPATATANEAPEATGGPLSLLSEASARETGHRIDIWKASIASVVDPVWFDFTEDRFSPVRPLVGYGPELFSYVALLSTPAVVRNDINAPFHYAHNHFVNVFVELGILGLAAYLGLLAFVFRAGVIHLRTHGPTSSVELRWLSITVLAGMTGWAVAGLSGIPRVSDLTLLWALLGVFVATSHMFQRTRAVHDIAPPSRPVLPRAARRRNGQGAFTIHIGRLAAGLVGVSLVASLTLIYNVGHLRASGHASEGVQLLQRGQASVALGEFDKAVNLAPEFPLYYLERGLAFEMLAQAAQDQTQKLGLLERAYQENLAALRLDTYSVGAVESAALVLVAMVELGEETKRDEAIRLLEQLITMMPYNYRTYEQLAQVHWLFADLTLAIAALDESLALTGESSAGARSGLIRGLVLRDLGQIHESIEAVEHALVLGIPDGDDLSQAHLFLALAYEEIGDDAQMAEHMALYDELQAGD